MKGLFNRQRREFKRLICNSRERLYRMAYSWTHDTHLSDDLVQQTLLKALNNHKQLRDMDAAQAWLFRILANCLTDYHRVKREVLTNEELVVVDNRTPDRITQEQQLIENVRYGVSQLPMTQRQVVTLVDLEEFAYATVAQILEIPVGTVMSRLCRGRRALRELLIEIKPQTRMNQKMTLKRIK